MVKGLKIQGVKYSASFPLIDMWMNSWLPNTTDEVATFMGLKKHANKFCHGKNTHIALTWKRLWTFVKSNLLQRPGSAHSPDTNWVDSGRFTETVL